MLPATPMRVFQEGFKHEDAFLAPCLSLHVLHSFIHPFVSLPRSLFLTCNSYKTKDTFNS